MFGPQGIDNAAIANILGGSATPSPVLTVGMDEGYATPEMLAAQRKRAMDSLARGSDMSPVKGGWAEGLARVAQGALGGLEQRRANEMAERNQGIDNAAIARALSGDAPDYKALMASPQLRGSALQMMAQDAQAKRQEARDAQRYAEHNARLDQQQSFAERQAEAQRQFQREQLALQDAARRDAAEAARAGRPVQTIQTAEGVFQVKPDGTLGNRLGTAPAAARETYRPATPDEIKQYGADPAVSWQVNSATGQMSPVGGKGGANANKLSATEEKEYFEALDNATASQRASEALQHALKLSGDAFSGGLADVGAAIVRNTPGNVLGTDLNRGAVATKELNSVMTEQALGQLKTIFGGNPTEGERKILLDMQASSRLSKPEREALINRALEAVRRRGEVETEKARAIAGNNDRYTSRIDRITGQAAKSYGAQGGGQGGETQPRGATGGWSADTKPQGTAPKRLKFNPATGDFE